MFACSRNHPKIVSILVVGVLDERIYPCSVNVMDSRGYTALHHASIQGNAECVKILLANGASQSLKDKTGLTAYAHARTEATRLAFPPPDLSKPGSGDGKSPLSSPRGSSSTPGATGSVPSASLGDAAFAGVPVTTAPVAGGPVTVAGTGAPGKDAPLLSGQPPLSTENVLIRAACEGGKAYESRFLQMMKVHAGMCLPPQSQSVSVSYGSLCVPLGVCCVLCYV